MRSFKSIVKAITHPRLVVIYIWGLLAPYIKNDKLYVKVKYFLIIGKSCNLENPKTYQEKLQWIKFYDRKPIYHQMVDKVEAKKFIAERVGEEYIIPTLGVWDRFEDIDFSALPNEFILKNTNDSGTYFICRDKSKLNVQDVIKKLSITWGNDYFIYSREWPYKGVKHRLIAEPLLHDRHYTQLVDYKFHTFNGEPKILSLITNRGSKTGTNIDYFDMEGNWQNFKAKGEKHNPTTPSLPINFTKMIEFSRILSKGTLKLRVDFYEIEGKLYVGELTFFDSGGFDVFDPSFYNKTFGDWIKLPIDNNE